MKKLYLTLASLVTLSFLVGTPVSAEELIISGNGDGSRNTITINTSSQTTVEQTNNATVTNDVASTANTGENSASSNSGGDVAITAGDIFLQTSIENSANISSVQAGCCPLGDVSMTIEGNGANSQNVIDTTKESSTTVTIIQIANIANNVATNANTGGNSANSNSGGGNITIDTGSITINQQVETTFINLAHVSAFDPSNAGDVTIRIVNNGSSSENSIFPKWFSDLFLTVDNTINIANVLSTSANTGGNSANGNNGDVSIITGDIVIGVTLTNGPINTSIVDVSCCPTQHGKGGPPPFDPGNPTPPSTVPPTGNGGGGGGSSSSSGSGGQGGPGEVLAAMLPITGINWFFATIANILMFLLGLYLRRRSGNSPGFAAYALAA